MLVCGTEATQNLSGVVRLSIYGCVAMSLWYVDLMLAYVE